MLLIGILAAGTVLAGCTADEAPVEEAELVEGFREATLTVEEADQKKEAAAAEGEQARPKPIASKFVGNPEQGCAFVLSTPEGSSDPDVLDECQRDYGVTPEYAPQRLRQGVEDVKVESMREEVQGDAKDD